MKYLLSFMLRMFLDQRGEAGDSDDVVDDINEDIAEVEDDDIINIDPDELEEDDDPGNKPDNNPDDQGDDNKVKDLEAQVAKQAETLEAQDKKLKETNRIFYGLRKKYDKLDKKDGETRLTDDQLETVLAENQDDPKALIQIIKQVSSQISEDKTQALAKASEVTARKRELEDLLVSMWPDVHNEGSEQYTDIQNAKEFLHVTDHPLGNYLAAAGIDALRLTEKLEAAKQEGRELALKEKTEKKRKEEIKLNSLESGKKRGSLKGLPTGYKSTAKQLNLSPSAQKIMAQIVKNGKEPATVEV